jgi:hypothetical protein
MDVGIRILVCAGLAWVVAMVAGWPARGWVIATVVVFVLSFAVVPSDDD